MIPNNIKLIVLKFHAYKPSWNEDLPLLEILGFTMIGQINFSSVLEFILANFPNFSTISEKVKGEGDSESWVITISQR